MKAIHINGLDSSAKSLACLSTQMVQLFGSCYLGVTPPGMSDLEFYSACMQSANAGMLTKLGCPGYQDAAMAQIPACLTKEASSEFSPITDYCRANPTFQGPNKPMNYICWGMSRYPALYEKALNTPLCAAAVTPPAYTPPASTPTPATTTTTSYTAPPPDTTAQVTYDSYAPDSSATTVPTDDTVMPGSDCASVGPNYTTDPVTGECVEKKTGMSTATMAMIGVGGVLALGLGYMLLKKK
jgi:hypothetical protein